MIASPITHAGTDVHTTEYNGSVARWRASAGWLYLVALTVDGQPVTLTDQPVLSECMHRWPNLTPLWIGMLQAYDSRPHEFRSALPKQTARRPRTVGR